MVKKSMTIEREVCDYCGDESKETYGECPICGKVACYECKKNHFTERTSEMHISSSGDKFCNECIANPPDKFKKLMFLFDKMDLLIEREKNFYEKQKKSQKALEERIKKEKESVFNVS
jgi:hypothetical protein